MKHSLLATVILVVAPCCHAASLSPDHPIVGTWRIMAPGTTCVETHTFRENGTKTSQSADEIQKSEFAISPKPSAAGYYKLTDTVVASNGKPDCSGFSSPVGETVSVFVRFERGLDVFSFCYAETQDKCVGPFRRAVGRASP